MTYPYTSTIGLRAAEIRRRLMNPPNAIGKVPLLPAMKHEPAPEPVLETTTFFDGLPIEVLRNPPLNMLAPSSWRFIVDYVSAATEVPVEAIISKDRARHLVAARTKAITLVWQHTQKSLPQVGRVFDRDHTTILHSIRKEGVTHKLVDLKPVAARNARPKISGYGAAGRMAARAERMRRAGLAYAAIRKGYSEGVAPERIALQLGYKVKSVKDLARRIGAQWRPAE